MSIVVQGEAPEPKKFRSSLPTQVHCFAFISKLHDDFI